MKLKFLKSFNYKRWRSTYLISITKLQNSLHVDVVIVVKQEGFVSLVISLCIHMRILYNNIVGITSITRNAILAKCGLHFEINLC